MNANLAAPDLHVLAPGFAARFTLIAAGLVSVIARAFLRHPDLAPLILPLCRRLSRNARRLAALMALLAAGRLPRRRRPGTSGGRAPKPPIPATQAWLISTLRHDAAAYASQLSHLLAQPGVSELLAAVPAARRLLNPLCRMLGIPLGDRCAARRSRGRGNKRPDCPDAPRGEAAPQATGGVAVKNPESPTTASSAAAPQATGVLTFKNPESALPPPPCPHVGWPWFPRPDAKPA